MSCPKSCSQHRVQRLGASKRPVRGHSAQLMKGTENTSCPFLSTFMCECYDYISSPPGKGWFRDKSAVSRMGKKRGVGFLKPFLCFFVRARYHLISLTGQSRCSGSSLPTNGVRAGTVSSVKAFWGYLALSTLAKKPWIGRSVTCDPSTAHEAYHEGNEALLCVCQKPTLGGTTSCVPHCPLPP